MLGERFSQRVTHGMRIVIPSVRGCFLHGLPGTRQGLAGSTECFIQVFLGGAVEVHDRGDQSGLQR